MSPHGTPDWGLVGPKTTTYGLDDLGELAVRLGSPHMWDRRGDVILQVTFEDGLGQAQLGTSGLGAAVVPDSDHSWLGGLSAKLTAGSTLSMYAMLMYSHGLPVNSRIGLEFTFTLDPKTTFWQWSLVWRDGATERLGRVRYDLVNDILEADRQIWAWTQFASDLRLAVGERIWHTGKLVVDFNAYEYVRFIMNGAEWDLTGQNIGLTTFGLPSYLFTSVTHYGTAECYPVGYVDNVVITQNEP